MVRWQKLLICSWILLLCAMMIGACASVPTKAADQVFFTPPPLPVTLAPSATPDMCAPNNIRSEVRKVYDLMRKFDDTVYVASLTSQTQLPQIVLLLQDVRRQTEQLEIAVCVGTLRQAAVTYQNATINYLAHFMGGVAGDQISTEMADSQNSRVVYDRELSRLLGLTYVPPPTSTPAPAKTTAPPTAQPALPSPTETIATPGGTAGDIYVTNMGVIPANLRDIPSIKGNIIGELAVGDRAKVLFRTPIGDWLLVQYAGVPDNLAWVSTTVVVLSTDISRVPVISAPTATPNT
jgi:hypothetical protein